MQKALILVLSFLSKLALAVPVKFSLDATTARTYYVQIYGEKILTKRGVTKLLPAVEGYVLNGKNKRAVLDLAPEQKIRITCMSRKERFEWEGFVWQGFERVPVSKLVEHGRAVKFGSVNVCVK